MRANRTVTIAILKHLLEKGRSGFEPEANAITAIKAVLLQKIFDELPDYCRHFFSFDNLAVVRIAHRPLAVSVIRCS